MGILCYFYHKMHKKEIIHLLLKKMTILYIEVKFKSKKINMNKIYKIFNLNITLLFLKKF
jgi:hypothetical protein